MAKRREPENLSNITAEELFVETEMAYIKKLRETTKTSKVKPRTINLTRKLN